ncbi:MAG: hypothetical protein KC496_22465, partial [Anaerolineae bacterium]|nr:hypothetical protein [Anaerolineae bacterium]
MSHTNAERNAGEGSKALSGFDPGLFTANMAKAGEIWQEIVQRIMMAQMHELEPRDLDPLKLQEAWARAVSSLASDPSRWVKMQTGMWQDYMQFWAHMGKRMLGHEDSPYIAPDERDRRFQDKAWNESLFFDAIKQSYLLASKWMRQSVDALGPMDKQTASKL